MPRETIDIKRIYLRARKPDVAHWLALARPHYDGRIFHIAFRRKLQPAALVFYADGSCLTYSACTFDGSTPLPLSPKQDKPLHIGPDMVLIEDTLTAGIVFYLHPAKAKNLLCSQGGASSGWRMGGSHPPTATYTKDSEKP